MWLIQGLPEPLARSIVASPEALRIALVHCAIASSQAPQSLVSQPRLLHFCRASGVPAISLLLLRAYGRNHLVLINVMRCILGGREMDLWGR